MEQEKIVISLPPQKYTLQQRNETQLDGTIIPMMILVQDGVEKICPFAPVTVLQPMISGGTPVMLRQPCNHRCGNFVLDRKEENGPVFAALKCGSGAFYELSMENALKKID